MTEPWTPGPWEWDGGVSVLGDAERPRVLFHCPTSRATRTTAYDATDLANARLIAAAPEMAALLSLLTAWTASDHFNVLQAKADALLSRIRGEA